jgi:uncharacterized protein (DUF302 family)
LRTKEEKAMQAMETIFEGDLEDAEAAVREALGKQGFGVLTEIDVAAVLRAKLGVDRPPLKILGACNPGFAHRALELDPSLALVLPCNVTLEALGGRRARVAIADPRAMLSGEGPDLSELAEEAAAALEKVVHELAT